MISPTKNAPLHLLVVFALKGALPRCRLRRDDVRMDHPFLGCLMRRGRFFFSEIGRVLQFNTSGKRTAVFLHSENRGKLPNNERNIQTSWIFRCYVVSFRFGVTVRGVEFGGRCDVMKRKMEWSYTLRVGKREWGSPIRHRCR